MGDPAAQELIHEPAKVQRRGFSGEDEIDATAGHLSEISAPQAPPMMMMSPRPDGKTRTTVSAKSFGEASMRALLVHL